LQNLCLFGQPYRASWVYQGELVPGPNLPKRVSPQAANNNLDMILWKGHYYFAFRTAPFHYASDQAKLYVMRSADMQKWTYETELSVGSDLREPRFFVYQDTLRMYCFQAGVSMLTFEPRKILALTHQEAGKWRLDEIQGMEGFVPWRLRTYQGTAYLSAYDGRSIYRPGHQGDLRLFTSHDGLNWNPISERPQVDLKGAEEGEFVILDNGELWATVRLEGGGGALAFAEPGELHDWHLIRMNRKYDSAMMFTYEGEVFLVARYHPAGQPDRAPRWLPKFLRHYFNLFFYILSKKRTALYWVDRENLDIKLLTLLPGNGDTAFAGIAPKKDGSGYWLANYTSPFRDKNWSWVRGQFKRTFIYTVDLDLHPVDDSMADSQLGAD